MNYADRISFRDNGLVVPQVELKKAVEDPKTTPSEKVVLLKSALKFILVFKKKKGDDLAPSILNTLCTVQKNVFSDLLKYSEYQEDLIITEDTGDITYQISTCFDFNFWGYL